MKNKTAWGLCVLLLMCAAVTPWSDAVAAERAETQKVPTSIKADRMDYDADGQTVVFNGNVYVKRPDFELWSTKLTVYLDKSGKKSNDAEEFGASGMQAGAVNHIVAEKDVRMKSNDREGTCQKATYYAKEDKIVMEGKPLLKDKKKNSITGMAITHYLKTNRSEVKSPIATFYAPDKTENPALPGSGNSQKGNR